MKTSRSSGAPALAPVALLLALAALLPAQETTGGDLYVEAGRVVTMSGKALENAGVLIRSGRVKALGRDLSIPVGCEVRRFPDGVIFPGFIDAGSNLGIYTERNETARPVVTDLLVEETFNPFEVDLPRVLRSGVTTLHLMPGDLDLVGGQTAVLEPLGEGKARFLERSAGVKISLVQAAWPRNRKPTSVAGGIALLAREVSRDPLLRRVVAGEKRAFVAAATRSEIEQACDLSRVCGIKGILMTSAQARHLPRKIAALGTGVILAPVLPAQAPYERRVAARLHQAGIPLAFMSSAPALPASSIRLSAQVSHLAGLPRDAAHAAMTLDAARLLGVDGEVGSLEPGKQGDLVVFSADPLDPRARILLVAQNGRVVHEAKESQ